MEIKNTKILELWQLPCSFGVSEKFHEFFPLFPHSPFLCEHKKIWIMLKLRNVLRKATNSSFFSLLVECLWRFRRKILRFLSLEKFSTYFWVNVIRLNCSFILFRVIIFEVIREMRVNEKLYENLQKKSLKFY